MKNLFKYDRQPEKNSGDNERSHDNHDLAGADNPNMPDNSADNNTNPYWNELQLADDLAAGTTVGWDYRLGLGGGQNITYKGNGEVEESISRGFGLGFDASVDKRVPLLSFNDDDLSGKSYERCGSAGAHLHIKGCGGYNTNNHNWYFTFYGGSGYGGGITFSEVYREDITGSNDYLYNLPNYDHNINGTFGWD